MPSRMRDEAIASLRRALAMFKKAEYERGVVSASRRLAVALSAAGHDQEAFELYNFVIDFRKNDIPMFSVSMALHTSLLTVCCDCNDVNVTNLAVPLNAW